MKQNMNVETVTRQAGKTYGFARHPDFNQWTLSYGVGTNPRGWIVLAGGTTPKGTFSSSAGWYPDTLVSSLSAVTCPASCPHYKTKDTKFVWIR